MIGVTLLEHPVVEHRVATLPRQHNGQGRVPAADLGDLPLLAYEALRDLGTAPVVVDTPVADGAPGRKVTETVLLVPVLRAGLGMVQAIQEVVPLTEVAHVGLRRDETDPAFGGLPESAARRPHRAPGDGVRPHVGHRWVAGPGVRPGRRAGRPGSGRPVRHRVGARDRRPSRPPTPRSRWPIAPPSIPR